jgi:hypothetical protein
MVGVKIDASQVISGCKQIAGAIPSSDQKGGAIAADIGSKGAKGRVHVVSGRLQRDIGVKINRPFFTRWGSDLNYAGHEEFRPGHSYAMAELHRMESGEIVRIYIGQLQSSI